MKHLLLIICMVLTTSTFAQIDNETLKRAIVKITTYMPHVLDYRSEPGRFNGSGFIVSLEDQYIITNRHVAPIDSGDVRVEFYNGIKAKAEIVYVDPILDISLIKFNKDSSTPNNLEFLKLDPNYKNVKNGDRVYLTGHDEGANFSIIEGLIINNRADTSLSNGLNFQTKIRSVGGSSGSPVINKKNQVIGLHFASTSTTSFEISSKHIDDILLQIKKKNLQEYYFSGIEFNSMSLNDAIKTFNPQKDTLLKHLKIKNISSVNEFLNLTSIKTIANFSPLKNIAQVGDLILEINGIKDLDPYLVFRELISKEIISMTILTDKGIKEIKNIMNVQIRTRTIPFIAFSGAVFKEVDATDSFNFNLSYVGKKVLCSFASHNSPFFDIASRVSDNGQYGFVIRKINNQEIENINDFYKAIRSLKNYQLVSLTVEDLNDNSKISNHEVYVNTLLFNTSVNGLPDPTVISQVDSSEVETKESKKMASGSIL